MVELSEFRSWDSRTLTTAADALLQRWRELVAAEGRIVDGVLAADWDGIAAEAAREVLRLIGTDFEQANTELLRVRTCVADGANDMAGLVGALATTESDAANEHFTICSDGSVVDSLTSYSVAQRDAWSVMRDRRRRREEIAERISTLLTMATEFDDTLADRLAGTAATPESAVEMPVNATPASNATFWAALSPAARTRLLVEQPALIGNLDGLPAQTRDAANRRVLAAERIRLTEVASTLESELDGALFGGSFSNADAGLAQTRTRLASLDAIEDVLRQGNRQLLVLDNSSYEQTMAAIAVGNVDTATHVAVFVPGFGSTVDDDIGRYDSDLEILEQTVQQRLSQDPSDSVAAVTWMDYQAPALGWGLLDPSRTVASDAAARAGADRLVPFLDGLDCARSTDPHLSVLAHSYGSLTAGIALRDTAGVDEFLALGSPGLGTHSPTDLSVPPGHVFAEQADGDLIADLAAFGRDPGALDGVTLLSTDASADRFGVTGHSDYLAAGSTSQINSALVVSGRSEEVVTESNPGLFDLLQRILYL